MNIFKDRFSEIKKASESLYKSPKSVQETIEILKISESGIFEVADGKYSKTYRFSDVNYATRSEDEQESFFQRYCRCLESIQRHTDSVMSIMPHVQRMNRKASFRDTAGALIHLTVHSR